jgi:hypothetical protein
MALTMDVVLNGRQLEFTRDRITEEVERRESEAAEDIEHDLHSDGDDDEHGSQYVSEDSHIDALFGMLDN